MLKKIFITIVSAVMISMYRLYTYLTGSILKYILRQPPSNMVVYYLSCGLVTKRAQHEKKYVLSIYQHFIRCFLTNSLSKRFIKYLSLCTPMKVWKVNGDEYIGLDPDNSIPIIYSSAYEIVIALFRILSKQRLTLSTVDDKQNDYNNYSLMAAYIEFAIGEYGESELRRRLEKDGYVVRDRLDNTSYYDPDSYCILTMQKN